MNEEDSFSSDQPSQMVTSQTHGTGQDLMDENDGTFSAVIRLRQDGTREYEAFQPEINRSVHGHSEETCQNNERFDQSENFLYQTLKGLTVKILVSKLKTCAGRNGAETRRVFKQGSGTLLIRHSRRRLPDDVCAQNDHRLESSQEFSENLKISVQTTRDLISDDSDAINSTVYIYNNENCEDVLAISGHHVIHSAIPGDRTVTMICQGVTRQMVDIVERLKEDFFHSIQQIPEDDKRRLANKAIMVSYPHGRRPRVSVGDFKEVKYLENRNINGDMRFQRLNGAEASQNQERLWRGIIHKLPTFEGSNGAPIITFKYDGDVFVHELWIHHGVALESRLKGTLLKLCTQEDAQKYVMPSRNPYDTEAREPNALRDPQRGIGGLPMRTDVHHGTPQAYQRTPQAYQRTPQAFQRTPQAYQRSPQAYQGTPQAYQCTPQAYQGTPQASQRTPQAYQRTPQAYEGTPQAYQGTPQAYQGTPQAYQPSIQSNQLNSCVQRRQHGISSSFQTSSVSTSTMSQDRVPAVARRIHQTSEVTTLQSIGRPKATRREVRQDLTTDQSNGRCNIDNELSNGSKQTRPTAHMGQYQVEQATPHGRHTTEQAYAHELRPMEQSNDQGPHTIHQATQRGYRGRHEIVTSVTSLRVRFYLQHHRTVEMVALHPIVYREELSVMIVFAEERPPSNGM